MVMPGDRDTRGVDAGEPASEPVIGRILNGIEERRRGHHELRRAVGNEARSPRRPRSEEASRVRRRRAVGEKGLALLQDQASYAAIGRDLIALGVDLPLGFGRDGLVRRQGIDREEARRMPAQPVQRHHPDPVIGRIGSSSPRARTREGSAAAPCDSRAAYRHDAIEGQELRSASACVPQGICESRRSICAREGGARRGLASITLSGLMSLPSGRRPCSAAWTTVVPRPMKGSSRRRRPARSGGR